MAKKDIEKIKFEKQSLRSSRRLSEYMDRKGMCDFDEEIKDNFYENLRSIFASKNIAFTKVRKNMKKKGFSQYHIVANNAQNVFVIETTRRLEAEVVDNFLEKIPKFKDAFPQFKDHRLFCGIGFLWTKRSMKEYAEEAGLYLIIEAGFAETIVCNRQGFEPKEF